MFSDQIERRVTNVQIAITYGKTFEILQYRTVRWELFESPGFGRQWRLILKQVQTDRTVVRLLTRVNHVPELRTKLYWNAHNCDKDRDDNLYY